MMTNNVNPAIAAKKRLFFFLLGVFLLSRGAAAPVEVPPLSADQELELLFTIGTILIDGNELRLVDKQGVLLYAESISKVRSIVIKSWEEALDDVETSAVVAFPNPTTEVLCLRGVEEDEPWRIYDLQGHLLTAGRGSTVPAAGLTQGSYLLQVKTCIIKFIKH